MTSLVDVTDALATHLGSLGHFDQVVTTDPDNAAASGITCSLIFTLIEPDIESSGLNISSAKIKYMARIWRNETVKFNYGIDRQLMQIVDDLLKSLHSDLRLGGAAMEIRILKSDNFGAVPGWIQFEDGVYRAVDVTIPVTVADYWSQEGV